MKRYTLVTFAGATALARALEEPGAMLLAMVMVFIPEGEVSQVCFRV